MEKDTITTPTKHIHVTEIKKEYPAEVSKEYCYKTITIFSDDEGNNFTSSENVAHKLEKIENSNDLYICSECGNEIRLLEEDIPPVTEEIDEEEVEVMATPFSVIYDMFLSKITDDMYMELTELDTFRMLEELFLSAIHKFEFPRFDIQNYEIIYLSHEDTYCGVESNNQEVIAFIYGGGGFREQLTREEINIIATYMIVEWLGQQLASVENTRMKYSGSDFKFTSQANHMSKLLSLKKDYEREGFHLQRLYKRRKKDEKDGLMKSTFGILAENSPAGREIGYYDNSQWYRNQ